MVDCIAKDAKEGHLKDAIISVSLDPTDIHPVCGISP